MEPTLESVKRYPRAMRFYIYTLYEFALENKCNKILELGVCTGQSTRAFLLALGENKKGTLVSVDHKNPELSSRLYLLNTGAYTLEYSTEGFNGVKTPSVYVLKNENRIDKVR